MYIPCTSWNCLVVGESVVCPPIDIGIVIVISTNKNIVVIGDINCLSIVRWLSEHLWCCGKGLRVGIGEEESDEEEYDFHKIFYYYINLRKHKH